MLGGIIRACYANIKNQSGDILISTLEFAAKREYTRYLEPLARAKLGEYFSTHISECTTFRHITVVYAAHTSVDGLS